MDDVEELKVIGVGQEERVFRNSQKDPYFPPDLYCFPICEISMLLSLPPFSLQKQENGNIDSRILIGCAPCTMIPVYTLPAARNGLL